MAVAERVEDGSKIPDPGPLPLFLYLALIITPPVIVLATHFDHDLNVSLLFFLAELFVVAIASIAVWENRRTITAPRRSSVFLALTVLAVSLFAALHHARAPDLALGHLAITLTHFALATTITALLGGVWRNQRRPLLFAMTAAAASQILATFVVIYLGSSDPFFDWKVFHAGAGNVRQLGFVAITLCALSAALAFSSAGKVRWICLAGFLLSLVFTNMIGGRAAFVANIVTLAAVVYLADPAKWARNAIMVSLVFTAAIPLSLIYSAPDPNWGFWRIIGRMNDSPEATDFSSGRFAIWKEAIELILQRPLLGHGEAQYKFYAQDGLGPFNHPHNLLLQFLFQWGLIGTAAALLIALGVARRALPKIATQRSIIVSAGAVVLAMVVMGSLDGNFFYPQPMMIVALSLAVMASASPPLCRNSPQKD